MESEKNLLTIQVKSLPLLPGCYIYKNKFDQIIYIGKSKSLRQRVKQYFTGMDKKSGKIAMLVNEIALIEHIVTESELDAILLECSLIKQHQPKYNTMLKQSPRFIYLKIDIEKKYPEITLVRENDTGEKRCYFGLFYSEREAQEALTVLSNVFHTPICNSRGFKRHKRPCFHYDLKKCCGPCAQMIPEDAYRQIIQRMIRFLQGGSKNIIGELDKKMKAASADLDYEKAAFFRDQRNDLIRLQNKNNRLHLGKKSKRLYIFLRPFYQERITVLFIQENRVYHRYDYQRLDQITLTDMEAFAADIASADYNHSNSGWQLQYILEVYCDKYFLPVYKKTSTEVMAKRLFQALIHMSSKDFEQKS